MRHGWSSRFCVPVLAQNPGGSVHSCLMEGSIEDSVENPPPHTHCILLYLISQSLCSEIVSILPQMGNQATETKATCGLWRWFSEQSSCHLKCEDPRAHIQPGMVKKKKKLLDPSTARWEVETGEFPERSHWTASLPDMAVNETVSIKQSRTED